MILDGLFEQRTSINTAHPGDPVLADWLGGSSNTDAGIHINADQAMRLGAVYACVRLLSSAIASLPLDLFKRQADGGRRRALTHPLYPLLHDQPNEWQTSFEWREMMAGHLLLRGNAYSEILSSGGNPVTALVPLNPDRVRPFLAPNGDIAYEYRPEEGPSRVILRGEMHHLRGLSLDGIQGLNPIEYLREGIGLTAAAEKFGSRYFGSGTVIAGVLKHPGALGDQAGDRLKKQFAERYSGIANSHKPLVLEEGMTWEALGIPPEQAQFLETRKFQVSEIARIFGVPPHMIGDLEKTSSWGTGIEQQGIGFVVYSLSPWLTRWEQAISRDLLTTSSRRSHYAEFNVNALLRGDTAARSAFYKDLFNIGVLSINEIRALENFNAIESGDEHYVPMNMARAGDDPQEQETAPAEPPPEPEPEADNRFAVLHRSLFQQALERIVTCEVKALRRALKACDEAIAFERRVAKFYATHDHFVMRHVSVLLGEGAQAFTKRHLNDSRRQLIAAFQHEQPLAAVECMLDEWERCRVNEILTATADEAWREAMNGH